MNARILPLLSQTAHLTLASLLDLDLDVLLQLWQASELNLWVTDVSKLHRRFLTITRSLTFLMQPPCA